VGTIVVKVDEHGTKANRNTTGTVFMGAMIELVADGTHEDRLKLLLWQGAKASIQSRVDMDVRPRRVFGADIDFHTITLNRKI
jgi:hypothetical protein